MRSLYIFKPHQEWEYCGGLACIVADSFAEAVSCFKEYERQEQERVKYGYTLIDGIQETEQEKGGLYVWVLIKTIPVLAETPVGVIAIDYNEA